MDFTFVERRPVGRLAPFVEQLWYARGTIPYRRELIAPTGSCVAVFVLGDPIIETPLAGAGEPFVADTGFLIGPHDGPVVNEPTSETHAIGIVTTRVGSGTVLGVEPARLRGTVADLLAAWPPAGELRGRLVDSTDPDAMLTLVTTSLEHQLRPAAVGLDRCAEAVAVLETDPFLEIRELAIRLGVSHGYLDREFLRHVGLTPRAVARIARLRRVLADLNVFGDVSWTRVANEAGWFDQSHFIRDFKRHTGVTPSGYLRSQRAEFTTGNTAPGFVPER